MKIQVRMLGSLKSYSPTGKGLVDLDLTDGMEVSNLLKTLSIPNRVQKVILVNGQHSKENDSLRVGDIVTLFSPLSGG
jgi:sulfur carrier protein ThiS